MLNDPWPHIKKQGWESVSLGLSKLYSDSVQRTLSIHPSVHSFTSEKDIFALSHFLLTDRVFPFISFPIFLSIVECHHPVFLHYGRESLFTTVHRLLNANGKKQKHARRQKHIRIPSLPQVFGIYSIFTRDFSAFFVLCVVQTLYNQHHGWVCWALDARDKVAALNIALNFSQTFPEGFLANGSFPEKIG